MKKILMLSTIFVASTALAFGGIFGGSSGSGRKSSGVDAIGVHVNGKGKTDIKIASCANYAGTGLQDETTYAGGLAGLADDNETQCRCPTGQKWDGSACIDSDGAPCSSWTTNECGSGYYCQFSPTDHTDDLKPTPSQGICKNISNCDVYSVAETGFSTSISSENCSSDWWTAQSICAAQNMQLASLEDLGCNLSELNESCLGEGTTFDNMKASFLGEVFRLSFIDLSNDPFPWHIEGSLEELYLHAESPFEADFFAPLCR